PHHQPTVLFYPRLIAERHTLSLHDALPIWGCKCAPFHTQVKISLENLHPHSQSCSRVAIFATDASSAFFSVCSLKEECNLPRDSDRKSTRLNSSHVKISYPVLRLQKKTR